MSEPGHFRRRVVLNTASTGLANAWAMVVALVSLPLLLRGMGPAVFGTWVLVQTFSATTGWFSLADVGAGTATARAVAERASLDDEEGVTAVIASSLAVFATLGLICAAAVAVLGPALLPDLFRTPAAIRPGLRLALLVFAGQIFLDLLTSGCGSCLEGLQRVDLSRAVDAIRRTLVAVATVVVAQADGGLAAVAGASVVASAAGTVIGVAVLRRHLPRRLGRPAPSEVRALLAYGRTVAVLRPLGVLHRTMDRMIAGAVLGPSAVSLVEIATQVQNGADSILSSTSYAVVPSAAWLSARRDHDTLRELLHRGTKYSLLVTVPAGVLAAVLAGPLVRVWIGPRFEEAAGLAAVALLYVFAVAPLQVGSNLLLGMGKAGAILRAAAAAIVVNFGFSVLLVHVTGVVGVFQATLLGTAVLIPTLGRGLIGAVGTTARQFIRDAVAPVLAPTAALGGLSAATLALPLGDVATLVLGTLLGVAGFAVVALRWSIDSGELRELRSLVGRAGGEG